RFSRDWSSDVCSSDLGLAVVLAGRGTAEVTGGDVDDAIRHLYGGEHLALPVQQPFVLGLGLVGRGVDEHLDLVELMHPDDAPGEIGRASCRELECAES